MKRAALLALAFVGWTSAARAAPPLDEAGLSAEALLSLATDPAAPADTLAALLARLPESYRASYVLVYDSRSLQSSTPAAPRVILYGADASFLLAYNGDPSGSHEGQLEIMQQNKATKDFELFALTFPKDGGRAGQPTLSEKNPPLCLSCHHSDPRPNWEPYPVWPGVYGSVHNGDPSVAVNETLELARFVAGNGRTGRYAPLVGLATRYTPTEDRPVSANNDDFTTILAQRNFERIVARLAASPEYGRYKYALLGATSEGCKDVTAFLPPAVQAKLGALAAVRFRTEASDARLKAQQEAFSGNASFFPEAEPQASLRYLLEPRGVDTSSFGLSFDPRIDSFGTGQFGIYDINQVFFAGDPDLRPFLDPQDPTFGTSDCAKLQEKSLAAFATPGSP